MGQAELRTIEFPRIVAADSASARVTSLYPAAPMPAEETLPEVDPKARRAAAVLFLGAVAAFWGTAAVAVSAYFL